MKRASVSGSVQFLHSPLLKKVGVKHGWFMRYGGVSSGLFESLNGKKGAGDSNENVDENRQRACEALGLKPNNLAHVTHAFKTNTLQAEAAGEYDGFDASITASTEVVLSQTTADCGSFIIADEVGSVVAMVHGSWHTLRESIIRDVVAKMKRHTNKELIAGIGPMICKNCYEFGAEAKDLFEPRYLTQVGDKYLVDLSLMIHDQLQKAGVTKIDDLKVCTLEDERFFSHRRSGAHSGRFITLATTSQQM